MSAPSRASDLLPNAVFQGSWRKQFDHGIAKAAVVYAFAIAVFVLVTILLRIGDVDSAPISDVLAYLFGQYLIVATPLVLSCLNVATRWRSHSRDAKGLRLADLAITLCVAIAALLVVTEAIGFFGYVALPHQTVSRLFYELLLQVAAIAASIAAVIWGLAELEILRSGAVEPAMPGPKI